MPPSGKDLSLRHWKVSAVTVAQTVLLNQCSPEGNFIHDPSTTTVLNTPLSYAIKGGAQG